MGSSRETGGDTSEARAAHERIDRQIEAAVRRTLDDLEEEEKRTQTNPDRRASCRNATMGRS
jgi:hypothetical protein